MNFKLTVWFAGKPPVMAGYFKTAALAAAGGDHWSKCYGAIAWMSTPNPKGAK